MVVLRVIIGIALCIHVYEQQQHVGSNIYFDSILIICVKMLEKFFLQKIPTENVGCLLKHCIIPKDNVNCVSNEFNCISSSYNITTFESFIAEISRLLFH